MSKPLVAAALAALVLFLGSATGAAYVLRYEYTAVQMGGATWLVRVDRLTGEAKMRPVLAPSVEWIPRARVTGFDPSKPYTIIEGGMTAAQYLDAPDPQQTAGSTPSAP